MLKSFLLLFTGIGVFIRATSSEIETKDYIISDISK